MVKRENDTTGHATLWVRPSRIKIINHVLQLLTPCAILSRDNMHGQLIHRVGVELRAVIDDMEDLRQSKAQAKTVNCSSDSERDNAYGCTWCCEKLVALLACVVADVNV